MSTTRTGKQAHLTRREAFLLAETDRLQKRLESKKRTKASPFLESVPCTRDLIRTVLELEKRGLVMSIHRVHVTPEGRRELTRHLASPSVRRKVAKPVQEGRAGYVVERPCRLDGPMVLRRSSVGEESPKPLTIDGVPVKRIPYVDRPVYVRRGAGSVHIQDSWAKKRTVCGLDVPEIASSSKLRPGGSHPWIVVVDAAWKRRKCKSCERMAPSQRKAAQS